MSKQKEIKPIIKISIILVGDTNVGKTSIFKRYYKNEFKASKNATIGVEFEAKEFKYKGQKYSIQIFDTAGQERFRSLTESYFHLGDGAFVVFDLTNKNSLISISGWIKNVIEKKPSVKMIILGNKDDLKDRQIPEDEINEVLEENNISNYIRVSAKNGTNIEKAFEEMIDLFENNNNEDENNENGKVKGQKLENKTAKKKLSCCSKNK
jgi:small GTP-binding protein